jgi:CubicO group peptidase (beta-lactamase class C family)
VSHQAGIRHYYGADSPEKTAHYPTIREALNLFIQAPLLFPPGTDRAYSSCGYVLVSAVVERVSGKPFLRYMQEDVWQPLGLTNTFARIPPHRQPDLTSFYLKDHPQGDWQEAPFEDLSFKWAGGGFTSNANDLVRFGMALLEGKFLSDETVRLMFSPQVTASGDTTGFGIGVIIYSTREQRRLVGHSGLMPTARSCLLLFPDEKLVLAFTANTAMTNFSDENLLDMANLFLDEQSDENRFVFARSLFEGWKGAWQVELENGQGAFEKGYLHFYEENNGLSGMILLENHAPGHLEIIRLQPDSMQLLAALPSHTALMQLVLKDAQLTGISVFNKPLTSELRKQLLQQNELQQLLMPKRLREGRKLTGPVSDSLFLEQK